MRIRGNILEGEEDIVFGEGICLWEEVDVVWKKMMFVLEVDVILGDVRVILEEVDVFWQNDV